ncbi:accessory gene regulator B family protein [Paenibacillus sp. FSL R10-2791]|uniref:accessory gene regulator B family protein n=1 Tax=unclassified Paenibacillus TaxID=185978 RepID=UPI0030F4CD0E
MIERLALLIASKIKQFESVTVSIDIMAYEIGRKLNNYIIILLTLFLSYINGTLFFSTVAMISFVCIRKYSGGLHMKSYLSCIISSVAIFIFVPMVRLSTFGTGFLLSISLIIYLFYAPNVFTGNIHPEGWMRKAKIISIALVIIAFYIQLSTVSLVFFVQAILILPWKGGARKLWGKC